MSHEQYRDRDFRQRLGRDRRHIGGGGQPQATLPTDGADRHHRSGTGLDPTRGGHSLRRNPAADKRPITRAYLPIEDILADYPYLEREDIMQALRYAA